MNIICNLRKCNHNSFQVLFFVSLTFQKVSIATAIELDPIEIIFVVKNIVSSRILFIVLKRKIYPKLRIQ